MKSVDVATIQVPPLARQRRTAQSLIVGVLVALALLGLIEARAARSVPLASPVAVQTVVTQPALAPTAIVPAVVPQPAFGPTMTDQQANTIDQDMRVHEQDYCQCKG